MTELQQIKAELDSNICDEDIAEHEKNYATELRNSPVVSTKTQFGYAFVLIKSKCENDMRKGIRLLEDLCHSGIDQRDFIYYIAVGYYRLKEYGPAIKYTERVLSIEPENLQATNLLQIIKEKRKKDALIGAAVSFTV